MSGQQYLAFTEARQSSFGGSLVGVSRVLSEIYAIKSFKLTSIASPKMFVLESLSISGFIVCVALHSLTFF